MEDVAGWIIIGTKLSTKQLERQLNEEKRKLQRFEKDNEKYTEIRAKLKLDLKDYEKEKELIQEETDRWLQYSRSEGNTNKLIKEKEEAIEQLNLKYSKQLKMYDEINLKIKENYTNQQLAKKEIEETTKQLNRAKGAEFFKDQNKGINSVIKKITRWGLALFGIRSAYMAIRQAMSTLSSFNEQLKNDLQYMRIAVASALEPIVEKIVNWMYKIMQYVQYIIYAWTGHNIFENASKNLAKANKNLDKLKANFDEINTLGNNNQGINPSVDLSKVLSKDDIPNWLDKLVQYKDQIELLGIAFATVFGIATISKWLDNIRLLFGASGGTGLVGLAEILAIIGTAYIVTIAIKGIAETINQIQELHTELDNLNISAKNANEKLDELIQKYHSLEKQNKITDEQQRIYNQGLNSMVEETLIGIEAIKEAKQETSALGHSYKEMEEIEKTKIERLEILIDEYNDLYSQNKLNTEEQKAYKIALEKVMEELAYQGKDVEKLQKKYENLTGKKYIIELETDAKTDKAKQKLRDLGGLLNSILNPYEWGKTIGRGLVNIFGFAKGGIVYSSIPKLASGGIINYPSRGVPLASAVGGENGREGVIPLTDSQQMALLGEAIGKYINLNATIPVYVGNRQIAREIKKINAEDDFAYNR